MRSWYAARPRRRVKMVAGPSMPDLARFIPSLPTLDLTGALDILLVAFVVYEALTVVRGTRAGHILIGILTMVSIYALASWTGLEALRSLLSFIVPYIGLAIIVLFQSEIRRTLARIGRKNWFGLAKGFRAPEALSEIMMAAEHFSQQKIGALIVLERDIGLRTFVESGVPLESRISAAACSLPLTTNPALARQLGTRHRAAIGITEETDCLSLVVSEETGRISVAAFGELSPGLSIAEVVDRINRHFGVRQPTTTQLEDFAGDIPLHTEASRKPPAERAHP